jgi:hypothetical protein
MVTVLQRVQCDSCAGTGLYQGMCESPGTAVICLGCDGTGRQTLEYIQYVGRKRPSGMGRLDRLRIRVQGRFIIGPIGGAGESMSYREFKERIPAKEAR